MKSVLILSIFAFVLASNAMASSKICFGSTKSEDTKGLVMSAEVSAESITLTPVKGETYNGTYPTYGTSVNGRDGNTYLEYKGENSDYQDVIMVDESLLDRRTTGLIQFRARGEGFFNSVYVCKDAR